MRYNKLLKILLCALMAALLCTGAAVAEEEELLSAHVQLYTEGAFPEEEPVLYTTFGMESFDSYMIEQLQAKVMTAYPEAIVGTYEKWDEKWPELFPEKPKISVAEFGMNKDEIYIEYQRLLNAHPELFYIYGGFQYWDDSEGIVQSLYPMFNYVGNELAELQGIYDSGVSAIVKYAKQADNDVARMLRASDYMCANFEYDGDYSIYSPELLFQKGKGVCQAYMLAYRAVLNELGIANITVSSTEINHTWNMVYLDDSWYHIDVTWNDPLPDVPQRAYHTNFLLSDAGIEATGHIGWDDGWEVLVEADNTKYDSYWWTYSRQVIPMVGDVGYYCYTDYSTTMRDVYAYDFDSETTELVYSFDYMVNGEYYKNFFPPVWATSDAIYYALKDKLYAVPIEGGDAELIYTTPSSDLWIWRPFLNGNSVSGASLRIYVSDHPQHNGTLDTVSLVSVRELTVEPTSVVLEVGASTQLTATVTPEPVQEYTLNWSSADETIAVVDENGSVTATGSGSTQITAKYDALTCAVCDVYVRMEDRLYLPANTVEIGDEAFAGTSVKAFDLPEGLETIGAKAFAGSEELCEVYLPDSLITIAEDAFSDCPNLVLVCTEGSVGATFAAGHSIPCIFVP